MICTVYVFGWYWLIGRMYRSWSVKCFARNVVAIWWWWFMCSGSSCMVTELFRPSLSLSIYISFSLYCTSLLFVLNSFEVTSHRILKINNLKTARLFPQSISGCASLLEVEVKSIIFIIISIFISECVGLGEMSWCGSIVCLSCWGKQSASLSLLLLFIIGSVIIIIIFNNNQY